MPKPTDKQVALLAKFEVEGSMLPLTKRSAAMLITFILQGNCVLPGGGPEVFKRAALYRRAHQEWMGKKVQYEPNPNRKGAVKAVVARWNQEVFRLHRESGTNSLFVIHVAWDDGTTSLTCASLLERLPD